MRDYPPKRTLWTNWHSSRPWVIVGAALWLAGAVAVYVGTTVSVRAIACVSTTRAGADIGHWQSEWDRAGDYMHAGLGFGAAGLAAFGVGTLIADRKMRLGTLTFVSLVGLGVLALLVARVLHQAPCEGL
jgi:hypothetical protein